MAVSKKNAARKPRCVFTKKKLVNGRWKIYNLLTQVWTDYETFNELYPDVVILDTLATEGK